MKINKEYIKKQGVIQENGTVLSDDNQIYQPDRLYNNTILLAWSSWSRYPIKEVEGKRVEFTVRVKNNFGYNFKLL